MKTSLLSLILSLIPWTASWAVSYVITAEVADRDGYKVWVVDYNNQDVINKGVIENGRLRIAGEYDRDAFVRVLLPDRQRDYANCLLDDSVTIDFQTHAPVRGTSHLNDGMLDVKAIEDEYDNAFTKIREEIQDPVERKAAMREYAAKHFGPYKERIADAIRANSDNGIGEYALHTYSVSGHDSQEWLDFSATLPPRLRELSSVKRADAKAVNSRTGRMYSDYEGKTPDGKPVKLSDYVGKGKYVLVDHYASWCTFCHVEGKKNIRPLYEKYKDDGRLTVLGVATADEREASLKAIAKHGYTWPQIIEVGKRPMELYGFSGLPQIMLFGPDGTLLAHSLRGDNIAETVEKYLNGN